MEKADRPTTAGGTVITKTYGCEDLTYIESRVKTRLPFTLSPHLHYLRSHIQQINSPSNWSPRRATHLYKLRSQEASQIQFCWKRRKWAPARSSPEPSPGHRTAPTPAEYTGHSIHTGPGLRSGRSRSHAGVVRDTFGVHMVCNRAPWEYALKLRRSTTRRGPGRTSWWSGGGPRWFTKQCVLLSNRQPHEISQCLLDGS